MRGQPRVRLLSTVFKGEVRYTVEITTSHTQMQVGISPQGHRITAYPSHPTQPGHWTPQEDSDA